MIIYCGGSFDVCHVGHVKFFENIKKLFPDSKIVVSLNTSAFIYKYKGKEPIFNYKEREEQLLMCSYVDEVIPNEGDEDSKIAIEQVRPDIIAVGTDWADKDYCKQMSFDGDYLARNNITLIFIPNKKIVSSSKIKSKIF